MKNKRLLILGAIVIVTIIAIIAILIPKFFQKNKTTTSQTSTLPIYVGCPVPQSFCAKSKVVKTLEATKTTITLLGWEIPKNNQIYAVFDGTMKQEIAPISINTALYAITITSSNGKYQAHYTFVSTRLSKDNKIQTLTGKPVKAKGTIGSVLTDDLGGLFSDQNVNLVFNVSFTNSIPINIQPPSVGRIVLP